MVEAGSGDDGALLRLYSTAIRRNRLLGDDQLAEALVVHEKVRRLGLRIDLLEVAVAHDLLSDKVVRSLRRLAAARGLSVEDSPRLLQGVTPEADHALGALAAQNLLIPPHALGEALDLQRALRDLGVERRIGELLVERGHLRAEILGDLLVLQAWLRDPRQTAMPDAGLVITPEDVRFGKVAIDLGVTEQAAVQEALHLQRTVLERTGLQLPVGEVLYGLGRMAGPDIERVLEEQRRRLEAGAAPALVRLSEEDNDRLGQVLRENRLATPEALDHAAQVQRALRDLGLRRRLGEVLILLGHLSAEDVRAALAVQQARRARRTGVAGGARRAPRAAGSGHGRRVAAVLLGLGALLVVFGVLAWSLLGPPTRGPRSDGEVVATGPEPGDELGGAGTGADALLAVAQEAEAARRLLRVQDLMWDEDVAIEALIGALEQIAERYPGTESGQRAGRLGANYREGLALRAGPPARVHRQAQEGGPEADDAGPGTRGEVGPGAGAGDDGEEVSASRDGPAPWETPGEGETAAGGGGEPAEGGGRTGPSTDEPAATGETVVEEPLDPRARREAQDRGVMGDAAGQVEWGAAHVLESRFYRIRSNVRPDQIRYYGALLDAYFVKYVRVFDVDADRVMRQRVAQVARKKCDIWIYGSHREFMERENVPETYGGFYSPSLRRIVAYHGYDRPDWNTRNTLVHEGCHQFQDLALGNLWNAPVWLIEGYATFFESAWFDGERVHIGGVPHDRLEGVKASIEAGDSTPLEKLIRMPQWEFSGKQYGEAWSLIYMIVYYNEDARRRRRNQLLFSQLFFSARGGPITPDQVEALFGGREKMRAFEADWRRYVVELPFDHDPARDGGPPAGETGE